MKRDLLRGALLALLLVPMEEAQAVGYHLFEAQAIGGVSEDLNSEYGFGLSFLSDEFDFWMTFGDPSLDRNHTLKEWWLESEVRGPVMGRVPGFLLDHGDSDPVGAGVVDPFHPFTSLRLGADRTTNRSFEWDWCRHLLVNLPGFFGAHSRVLQLGPTVGLGVNLTWWRPWKNLDSPQSPTINTGKFTGELGGVLGFSWRDSIYAQGRLTWARDLFGIHQENLNLSALTGFSLNRVNVPFGLELSGELDQGNDTWDTEQATTWSVHGALVWRLLPSRPDRELERVMESLRGMVEVGDRESVRGTRKRPPPRPPAPLEIEEPVETPVDEPVEGAVEKPVEEPVAPVGEMPAKEEKEDTEQPKSAPSSTEPGAPGPKGPEI